METRKGEISNNTLLSIIIVVCIVTFGCLIMKVIGLNTEPRVVKVSTYTDREVFVDLKTLEPVEEQPTDILRIEFTDIEDANNNYVRLEGEYPIEFEDRIIMAKNYAVLKGIVTREELEQYKPNTRETIGNTTIVKYKK